MNRFTKLFIIICALLFSQPFKLTVSGVGETFEVNTRGDEGDYELTDGICWNGVGQECTLRAAIEQANYDPTTADTIEFNIRSGFVLSKVINVGTTLPALSSPMSIQGPNKSDSTKIVLDGQGLPFGGVTISSDDVLLDSISISQFGDYGINIIDAENVSVMNCTIGKFQFNPLLSGNGSHGIFIINATGVTIQNSRINDNGGDGILIQGGYGHIIRGNVIGLEVTGTTAEPNAGNGIRIVDSDSNVVGGNSIDERNIISGNALDGLLVEDDSLNNIIMGNFIGSDLTGTKIIANQMNGIEISNAFNTQIGGVGSGEGNLIYGNTGDGVAVKYASINNPVIGNSIYMNGGLGINLIGEEEGTSRVTPNDIGDADIGANQMQNFPVITNIKYEQFNTRITLEGILESIPIAPFTLHFYGNDSCDLSGYGEGMVYLGGSEVATSSSGVAEFSITLPVNEAYDYITATATDSNGNTSEFSECEILFFSRYLPLMMR